jgi:DNA-binding ferritin-like protein
MYSPAPGMQPADVALKQPEKVASEPKASSKQKPKTNLDQFIRELTGLASYMNELRLQAHLIHFNYEAGNFLGIHKFLKKQYLEHEEHFDRIGELIRSMDYFLPMCSEGLREACPSFKHVKKYQAKDMLLTYLNNLENLGMATKKTEAAAAKIKAIDVQNYMAELCEHAFKSAWFIKASLRNS